MTPALPSLAYAEFVETACSALGLTQSAISQKYAELPHCFIEYRESRVCNTIIEIRFDAAHITLSCHFGTGNTCHNAFLFFDDREEIDSFIDYLNSKYPYNYIKSCWTLPNCYILIKPTATEVFASFFEREYYLQLC